jgi:hypothetical protein
MEQKGNREPMTKMTQAQWRAAIIECVADFANRDWQSRAWFGKDPNSISSPDEMICQLCDDLQLETFIEEQSMRLSEMQRTSAAELLEEIELFCEEEPQASHPGATIDHPRWERIRSAASKFLKAFSS